MKLYDYLFYRLYIFYRDILKEGNHSAIYALVAVSIIQFMHVFIIYILLWKIGIKLITNHTPIMGLGAGVFIILINYFFVYSQEKKKNLINKWDNEHPVKRKKRGWMIIILIICSFVLPIILSIK